LFATFCRTKTIAIAIHLFFSHFFDTYILRFPIGQKALKATDKKACLPAAAYDDRFMVLFVISASSRVTILPYFSGKP
jgi:hypothetical protein